MKSEFKEVGKELRETKSFILIQNAETHNKINKALYHLKRAEQILKTKGYVRK